MNTSTRVTDVDGDRTEEQFRAQVGERTYREWLSAPVIAVEFGERNRLVSKVEDFGIANNGEFISDKMAEKLGIDMSKPDFKFYLASGKIIIVEVMCHSEVYSTCTVKSNKSNALLHFDSYLAIVRERYMDIYSPSLIKELHQNRDFYKERTKLGGKPGFVLQDGDVHMLYIDKKIQRCYWNQRSLEVMAPVFSTIFPESTAQGTRCVNEDGIWKIADDNFALPKRPKI